MFTPNVIRPYRDFEPVFRARARCEARRQRLALYAAAAGLFLAGFAGGVFLGVAL